MYRVRANRSVVKSLQQCTEYKLLNAEDIHYACEGEEAVELFFIITNQIVPLTYLFDLYSDFHGEIIKQKLENSCNKYLRLNGKTSSFIF